MIIRENDLEPEQEAKSPTRIPPKKKRMDDMRANSTISVIEIAPQPRTSRNHLQGSILPNDPDLLHTSLKKKNKTTKP